MRRIQPPSVQDIQEIVSAESDLVPTGGGSKSALSSTANGANILDMSKITGIIEYVPDEYTFTAYAGTPVAEVQEVLAKHSQYLPFDPILAGQGATLGGTVAANTAGSGRYRYGGVRDFILGVQFVDGQGRLVKSGGKVVKNAAGFDLSKFMVGSLGRYGVLVSMSFKVFPRPQTSATLLVNYPDLDTALTVTHRLAGAPVEIESLDIIPKADDYQVAIKLGGLAEVLPERVLRIQLFLDEQDFAPFEVLENILDTAYWHDVSEFGWVEDGRQVIKIPILPKMAPSLDEHFGQTPRRYTVGMNIAWLATNEIDSLQSFLTELGLVGQRIIGPPGRPYLGVRRGMALALRVKQALDPESKFLEA